MKLLRNVTLGLTILVVASQSAKASVINFEFSGTATGSLNGSSATTFVQIDIFADTTNLSYVLGADTPSYQGLSGTIFAPGIGSALFSEPLYIFYNQTLQVAGFGMSGSGSLLEISVPGGTYDMTYATAQLPGSLYNLNFFNMPTSAGDLTITGFEGAIFSATTGDPLAVPEPSGVALAGLGGLGLAVAGYRRRKLAAA